MTEPNLSLFAHLSANTCITHTRTHTRTHTTHTHTHTQTRHTHTHISRTTDLFPHLSAVTSSSTGRTVNKECCASTVGIVVDSTHRYLTEHYLQQSVCCHNQRLPFPLKPHANTHTFLCQRHTRTHNLLCQSGILNDLLSLRTQNHSGALKRNSFHFTVPQEWENFSSATRRSKD